ncbi:SWIM zinc finger family protein [Candidatus Woesearchaeota archaeon]|nr:SWIM zinc finger family protein [Candidatus Woesearchaeota archaeon]
MTQILHSLSEKNIQSLCGNVIYQRGKEYFIDKRVRRIRFDGNTVIAEVVGNDVYEVEISGLNSVKKLQELNCSCSCPYEGLCKHVVAVLIHLYKNKTKRGVKNIGLDSVTKDELVQIISTLIKESPSLANRINILTQTRILNQKEIDKKLRSLFSDSIDYKSMNSFIKELNSLKRVILLAAKQDYKRARSIAEQIITHILNPNNYVDDSSGKLGDYLYELLELTTTLVKTDQEREEFTNTFFPIYINEDTGYGDTLGEILIKINKQNLTFLETYCLRHLNQIKTSKTKNKKQNLYRIVSLLLGIYDETNDPDKYIELCKQNLSEYDNMHLVDKLIELGRTKEALQTCLEIKKTRKVSPYILKKIEELKNS